MPKKLKKDSPTLQVVNEVAYTGGQNGGIRYAVSLDVVAVEPWNNRSLVQVTGRMHRISSNGYRYWNLGASPGNLTLTDYGTLNKPMNGYDFNMGVGSSFYNFLNEQYWIGHDANGYRTVYVEGYHDSGTSLGTARCGYNVDLPRIAQLPYVSTGAVTDIQITSFIATGTVTDERGATVTDRGFVLALHDNPTVADTKVSVGSGGGVFSTTISDLTSSTNYYVRAFATNSRGTSYGAVVPVTTSNAPLPPSSATTSHPVVPRAYGNSKTGVPATFVAVGDSIIQFTSLDTEPYYAEHVIALPPAYGGTAATTKAEIEFSSYDISNVDRHYALASDDVTNYGQSFQTNADYMLTHCQFYLRKNGTPTGNVYAKLYSVTGTFGVDNKLDQLLATSDPLNPAIISDTSGLYDFYFSGVEQAVLRTGETYAIVIDHPTAGTTDYINVGGDYTNPSAPGNWTFGADGNAAVDLAYYLFGELFYDTPLPTTSSNIDDMVFHKEYLWICREDENGTGPNVYRYNMKTELWQDMGGKLTKFAQLRGTLYGINSSGVIYSITGEAATAKPIYTSLGVSTGYPKTTCTYNGAIWIADAHYIWRFDGVAAVKVITADVGELVEYQGSMYYTNAGWLTRFTGSVVERLQYLGKAYGFCVNAGLLFMVTSPNPSRYDRIDSDAKSDVIYFNGTAFYLVHEHQSDMPLQTLANVDNTAMIFIDYATDSNVNIYGWPFNRVGTQLGIVGRQLAFTSSEFSGGYDNAWKIPLSIEVDYNNMSSSDEITVYILVFDGRKWTPDWIKVGTLLPTDISNRIELLDLSATFAFKSIRVKAQLTKLSPSSSVSIKRFTIGYTLQPRQRLSARITFMPFGNDATDLVHDRLNNVINESSNQQFGFLNSLLVNKVPLYLIGPHFAYADKDYTSTDVSFSVKGNFSLYYPISPYANEYPLIAYTNDKGDTWHYLQVTSRSVSGTGKNTITTFTVLKRDMLFSANLMPMAGEDITENTIFATCWRMYCNKMLTDRLNLSDNIYSENFADETFETQLKRLTTYEFLEV